MSTDPDYIYVDTEKLMEVAQLGYQRMSELEGYVEDFKRWMSIIDTFWKGAAAEAYQERLEEVMIAYENNKDILSRYPKRLEGYANTYGQADAKAQQIAASVEQAVWADV